MQTKRQARRDRIATIAFFLFIAALPAIVWFGLAIQCARPFICHA